MTNLQWDGDGATDHVRKRAAGFLRRAAMTVQRRAKQLLSIAGTAVRSKSGDGGRKGSRIYGAVRSAAGQPPRKQTGLLRLSVTSEVDESAMEARVGTNFAYGKHLELGTKRGLAPRPWLRRAMAEMQSKVNQLLAQGDSDQ